MFTGIIQAVGEIKTIELIDKSSRMHIHTGKLDLTNVSIGDSIAVNGVCLTATQWLSDGFLADLSAETLACTTFSSAKIGDSVNLEKCLTPTTALGGHFVTGHVDAVGEIIRYEPLSNFVIMGIQLPADLARFVASKGSITVDGISLTVNEVTQTSFLVTLVPHTIEQTTLQHKLVGSRVNLEVDIIARYTARFLSFAPV